jgi:hypothetical protein
MFSAMSGPVCKEDAGATEHSDANLCASRQAEGAFASLRRPRAWNGTAHAEASSMVWDMSRAMALLARARTPLEDLL